jgi:hypothetical protein
MVVAAILFVTALVLLPAIQAAEVPNGQAPRQQINAESGCVFCEQNNGLSGTGNSYGLDGGLTRRFCCCHHPIAIYHPEVYNYRYFYNIVGHEAYSNSPHYRFVMPAARQPEEIFTPVPERENQLPQTAGSARLTRPDQKKFQK